MSAPNERRQIPPDEPSPLWLPASVAPPCRSRSHREDEFQFAQSCPPCRPSFGININLRHFPCYCQNGFPYVQTGCVATNAGEWKVYRRGQKEADKNRSRPPPREPADFTSLLSAYFTAQVAKFAPAESGKRLCDICITVRLKFGRRIVQLPRRSSDAIRIPRLSRPRFPCDCPIIAPGIGTGRRPASF